MFAQLIYFALLAHQPRFPYRFKHHTVNLLTGIYYLLVLQVKIFASFIYVTFSFFVFEINNKIPSTHNNVSFKRLITGLSAQTFFLESIGTQVAEE